MCSDASFVLQQEIIVTKFIFSVSLLRVHFPLYSIPVSSYSYG